MQHKHGYRPEIDGLRSIAVLLVVFFHFGLSEVFEAGFVGVDIFFAISGYLIIPRIIDQLGKGQFRFADFYARRVRRLAPALLATIVLTLLAGLILLTPLELSSLAGEALFSQVYASNIYYWRTLNYFGVSAESSFLGTFGFLETALARHPNLWVIRPADAICRKGTCAITEDGRPLYRDDAHPAQSQVQFFGGIIAGDLSRQ